MQFASALFNGNETSGFADIGVVLTGVIQNDIEVRYADFNLLKIAILKISAEIFLQATVSNN